MTPLTLERPSMEDILFICDHAAEEDQREWGSTHWGGWNRNTIATTIGLYMEGVAHVFREADGTPFCASGFHMSSPGVARSWTIRTEAWKHNLVQCVRMSRRVIAALLQTEGVNRLEAWCPSWADRWPQALGLEREAVLRHYATDGTDIVIWSRVKE